MLLKTAAEAAQVFSALYRLDGDVIRCRECGRGIHLSYVDQDLHHDSECLVRAEPENPWAVLHGITSLVAAGRQAGGAS